MPLDKEAKQNKSKIYSLCYHFLTVSLLFLLHISMFILFHSYLEPLLQLPLTPIF